MSFVLIFINIKMNIVLLYLIIVFRVLNNICYSFTFVRKIHYIFVLIEIVLTVTTMK